MEASVASTTTTPQTQRDITLNVVLTLVHEQCRVRGFGGIHLAVLGPMMGYVVHGDTFSPMNYPASERYIIAMRETADLLEEVMSAVVERDELPAVLWKRLDRLGLIVHTKRFIGRRMI